jgi:hypothetical protein
VGWRRPRREGNVCVGGGDFDKGPGACVHLRRRADVRAAVSANAGAGVRRVG